MIFRGIQRSWREVWSRKRFNASLWAFIIIFVTFVEPYSVGLSLFCVSMKSLVLINFFFSTSIVYNNVVVSLISLIWALLRFVEPFHTVTLSPCIYNKTLPRRMSIYNATY